jgi:hypothetical protein
MRSPIPQNKLTQSKIDQFVEATRLQLEQECISNGYRKPNVKDLIHMQEYGTFPDENI